MNDKVKSCLRCLQDQKCSDTNGFEWGFQEVFVICHLMLVKLSGGGGEAVCCGILLNRFFLSQFSPWPPIRSDPKVIGNSPEFPEIEEAPVAV